MPSPLRAPTRQLLPRARLGTRLLRPRGSGITGRTATVAESASATTITGTRPADRQTGDYVIAHFSMSCTAAQFTGPGGSWTQLVAPTANAASETVAVYGMFDPPSDPVGTSSAVAGRQTCIMQAYGGVDPTTPIDVSAATPTSGTMPVTIPQVTTVTAGARLISGVTGDFSTGNWIGPPEMGLVATQTSGTGRGAALADEVRPVAGATGSRQWSASSLVAAVGYMFALRPAPMPVVREFLANNGSGANVSVTTGAGTVAGDLILVFHSNDFDSAANLTAPTTGSWTLRATGDSGNGAGTAGSHVKVWSGSAAGGAQTITVAPTSFGEEHSLHVVVFAGACTVDGAAGGNGSATTLQVSPAVSTAGSPRLLFSVVTSNGSVAGNYTPPPGMAEGQELDDATFAFTASLGSETLLNAGSTGTRTWQYSSASGVYAAVSIAVKGVAAAGSASGTASIAGAGAVTANVVQGVGAAIAGAGAVSALVTQGVAASIAGAGTLSAPVVQGAGSSPTGAGSLSAAGSVIVPGTATIAGAGTLTASSAGAASGTATITGAGTVTAVVTQGASASPTGAGTLSATVVQPAAASPAGAGTLTASVVQQATAAIAGAGVLSASSSGAASGTASPTGVGVLSANVVQQVVAAVAGAGSVTANVVQQSAASPTGAGVLSATVVQRVTATLTGAGVLTANAQGTSSGTAAPAGVGTVSATATVTLRAPATITGAGTVVASGVIAGTAAPTGAGSLTANVRQQATAVLAGAGSVTATAGFTLNATASIAGAGAVTATGRPKWVFRPNTGTTSRPNSGRTGRPVGTPAITLRP